VIRRYPPARGFASVVYKINSTWKNSNWIAADAYEQGLDPFDPPF
jgi:hypothetical protein